MPTVRLPRGSGHLGNRSTMTVYLRRRPLLLSSSTPTSRCACPCAMLFASPTFTGGLLWQAYLWSQLKLEKGRGRGCCCGAVLWPPLYLWSQPKLEKGRGAGCCGGAVLWPPLYLWSRTKLEKGRGAGCCGGAALWPPLYLWSRTKLEKGVGLAAAAVTVLYRRRRCSVVRTVSYDNNDYHCTAAENMGYHSRGRHCDCCMTEAI